MRLLAGLLLGAVLALSLTGCANRRTFPKELVADLEDYRPIIGYDEGRTNSDGSVTYSFTKEQREKLLTMYKEDIEAKIAELTGKNRPAASISSILHSDDYAKFYVIVNSSSFDLFDTAYALPFLRTGAVVQILNGADYKTVDVSMEFVDLTGVTLLDPTTYQRIFKEE